MRIRLPESEAEFVKTLEAAAKVASVQTLVSLGYLKPYVSLRESYRLYGEGTINRWLKEGVIKKIKDGEGNSKIRINRVQLEAAAQTQNRAEWYVRQAREGKLKDF
jgi:hypothetical protein